MDIAAACNERLTLQQQHMIKCRLRFVKGLCARRTLYRKRGGEITKSAAARALPLRLPRKKPQKILLYEYVGAALAGFITTKEPPCGLTSFLHSAPLCFRHWGG